MSLPQYCWPFWTGKLLPQQVGKGLKDFVEDYSRDYETFKTLSLDELIPATNTRRLDMLATEQRTFPHCLTNISL